MPNADLYLFPGETVVANLVLRQSAPDPAGGGTNYPRTATETITAATDTVSRTYAGNRTATETLAAAADTLARSLLATRLATETITPATDTVSRRAFVARSLAETIPSASDVVVVVIVRPVVPACLAISDRPAAVLILMEVTCPSV